ncbi:IEC3 subunit of the Ino80 complex, chromatin re-modelling-domain-containing protein [Xylariales sp. AK1849]|nr:IEC3 subunit of the Ino80 complex, chromatin re-modelling-domain-containing protein [Xylariales sp. AK1849]
MDDRHIKAEPGLRDHSHDDTQMADSKPSYKSWKKKYRKMRLQFDHRMQQSEDLHRLEQKALRTAKRLAIENDRLVDFLMDINDSPQIPPERRIDLSLNDDDDDDDNDTEDEADTSPKPSKSLKRLIEETPHNSFAATVEHYPEVLEDLQPKDPEVYPTSFLKADDIDTYLAEVDMRIGLKAKPAVPPPSQSNTPNTSAANFALHNPTSVYNWLRKHAPKTFLQDLEKDKEKDKEKDHDNGHSEKAEGGNKRKSGANRGTKRPSAASRKEVEKGEPMEWDEEATRDNNTNYGSLRGKRKRDDDPGYRPKGGSSRPTKKRARKSVG